MKASSEHSITQFDVNSLTPHPDNPRVHSKAQIKQIANSIQSFGFKIPILVDRNHQIIAGHGRVEAAKLLNMAAVPAVVANDLTSIQSRALMIADNKLTENAQWDTQLLANNFQILNDLDLNFDLDVTGFDYGEIEQLLILDEPALENQESLLDIDASLPAVSQLGDIWQLGKHRIVCGNSLNSDSYKTLLGEQTAQLVFSDPPYNLPSSTIGKVCEKQHGNFQFASGEMSQEAFIEFLTTVFSHCRDFSNDGSIHYHCMDWRHLQDIITAGLSTYDELKNICVWVKDRAGMGSFYRSQHEMVMVFKKGGATHQNHFKLGQNGRYRTNVWSYPAVRMVDDTGSDSQDALSIHPTVKPVAMIMDALQDCSRQHENILDPFLGSGSTLIACEKTKRCCYGIEIEPKYINATIRRWQAMTGLDAVCLSRNKQRFSELEQHGENTHD